MLGGAKLIAFVATADAGRARLFYEETLRLTLVAGGQQSRPYSLL